MFSGFNNGEDQQPRTKPTLPFLMLALLRLSLLLLLIFSMVRLVSYSGCWLVGLLLVGSLWLLLLFRVLGRVSVAVVLGVFCCLGVY